MQIRNLALSKINPAPYNPRQDLKPDDARYQHLVRSMETFGCVEPLVWNRRTGHLVGGHQRFKVLLAQGHRDVQVSVVDLPLAREKALNLALNKVGGDWDRNKLSDLLAELTTKPEFDLEVTGFELPEVEQLWATVADGGADEDAFDVERELSQGGPAVTQPGELIELGLHGEHRLLCGDATRVEDALRLLDNQRAALCHMDPPYGVSYDRRRRPGAKGDSRGAEPIRNDDLTPRRYRKWFGQIVAVLAESLIRGGPFYIWNGHGNFGLMHDLLSDAGFHMASVITWAKESFAPGFGDYNEQTEYCLYGWKGGARHRWYGPKNASTLWRVRRDHTRLYRHPTQKSLELAERAVRNSSRRGDVVLDPFLGSGTTLIAAARLGRRCCGMEIEPRYCDCIVRRYIALAGSAAVTPQLLARYGREVTV